jgi:hypothetical protein
MSKRKSIISILNGITDSDSRFPKVNLAMSLCHDMLDEKYGKIVRNITRRCMSSQPQRRASQGQEEAIKKAHYLKFGRFAPCFSIKELLEDMGCEETINNEAHTMSYLKTICQQMVLHRFIVRDGRISAIVYTYNRHPIQYGFLKPEWKEGGCYIPLVLPCSLRGLADPLAQKHAAYLTARQLMKTVVRNNDWRNLDVGVSRTKRLYCDEFIWSLICGLHSDVKKGIPRFRDFDGDTDTYLEMVCTEMDKFDPWYGMNVNAEVIKNLKLPLVIKRKLLLELDDNFSDEEKTKFLKFFYCERILSGTVAVPEFVEYNENSGTPAVPEMAISGTPAVPEKNSGTPAVPETDSKTGDKYMEINKLQKNEKTPLRVNLRSIQELVKKDPQKMGEVQMSQETIMGQDVAVMDSDDNLENEQDLPYNDVMLYDTQEDRSLRPNDIDAKAFKERDFNVSDKKRKISKVKSEEKFVGESTLRSLAGKNKRRLAKSHQPTSTIMNTPKLFISTYHKIVTDEIGMANFPDVNAIGIESQAVHAMWDIMRNENSFDEIVLIGWMHYAARQFKGLRRPITVSMMKKEWDGYKRFRPTIHTGKTVIVKQFATGRDSIGISMDMIFSSCPYQDAVWKACKSWGVVLVANWIAFKNGNYKQDIKVCLESHIATESGKADIRDILSATQRWEHTTKLHNMAMSDWRMVLTEIISKVGIYHEFDPRESDSESVATFIKNITVGKTI